MSDPTANGCFKATTPHVNGAHTFVGVWAVFTDDGADSWTITYRGGYLLPSQAFETVGLAASAPSTLTLSGGATWPKHLIWSSATLARGGWVRVTAIDTGAPPVLLEVNDRVSDTAINVNSTLVPMAAGPRFRLEFHQPFPGSLERAALLLVAQRWHAAGRDPALSRMDLGEESYEWSRRDLVAELQSLLRPYLGA